MKKVKKIFIITEAQAKWIEAQSKKMGLAQSDLLRRILDKAQAEFKK